MVNRKFLYLTLLVLVLMYSILFPARGFAEEAQTDEEFESASDIVEPNETSGRRHHKALSPSPAPSGDQSRSKGKNALLKIGQVNPNLELGISLLWDYDYFHGADIKGAQKGNQWCGTSELRQASIALKSKLNRDWQAKLEVIFNDEGDPASEIDDAYIKFTGWNNASLTIGKDKEPFGLEELTSSEDITPIERSMATHAFAPGRQPGLGLSGDTKQFTWAIGVYKAIDRGDKGDTCALTGRLTFTPWQHKKNVLHLGIAGSSIDYSGEVYEIKERAEVHTAKKIVVSAKTLADKVNLLGLEAAWVIGPFSLQAEYMAASVKADISRDVTYAGYYLQGSYFLTGESRPFKKGTFERIKPATQHGALEIMSRYSVLDAGDGDTENDPRNSAGVKAANVTLGMNYYLSEQVRLTANYIKTKLSGDVKGDKDSADALSFRVQYSL